MAGGKIQTKIEAALIVLLAGFIFWLSSEFDLMERFVAFSKRHESLELDELTLVSVFLVFVLLYYSIKYAVNLRASREKLARTNRELEKTLAEVKQLKGILPICASCKKIRDDKGYWREVERYIDEHSEAGFTHGICPDCARKLYPELYENKILNADEVNRETRPGALPD